MTAKEKAQNIINQLSENRYAWVGVKRFRPEQYETDSERFIALEKHHEEESKALIQIIKELSQELVK